MSRHRRTGAGPSGGQGEIATRYFGRATDILTEVQSCGFQIARSEVEPPADDTGQTLLTVDAVKPRPAAGNAGGRGEHSF